MHPGPELEHAVGELPLGPLWDLFSGTDAYLVGGAVRDLVRGAGAGPDIDIALEGDLEKLLARLAETATVEVAANHARFGTATVILGALSIDLARTRSETYPSPGALPDVSPAPIGPDLARRDFTVNAMAVSLHEPRGLLDPFDGAADLASGTLRVLHERSFVDDPTRAIRAARYAARVGLRPDPATLELLRATDLGAVSRDRRREELARLAAEPTAARGFELLSEWGLIELPAETTRLIARIVERGRAAPWNVTPAERAESVQLAVEGGEGAEGGLELARAAPRSPSEAVRLASGRSPAVLLLAAGAGGDWLDRYVGEWRWVRLEIDGEDLIAAGVPQGPAVGAGLAAALEGKLDGELTGGREAELALALARVRSGI